MPFTEVPTGVSGHMSPSAGQTEGGGKGTGHEEGEATGVGDAIDVAEFCTVTSVTFSTACRGRLALLPAKSLAVSGRSDQQLLEALDTPLIRVQDEL